METPLGNTSLSCVISSYRTYEEWKPCTRRSRNKYTFVLTVPMRNGNAHYPLSWRAHRIRSYRTYEEWKLYIGLEMKDNGLSSYRTYEEWKLIVNQVSL